MYFVAFFFRSGDNFTEATAPPVHTPAPVTSPTAAWAAGAAAVIPIPMIAIVASARRMSVLSGEMAARVGCAVLEHTVLRRSDVP